MGNGGVVRAFDTVVEDFLNELVVCFFDGVVVIFLAAVVFLALVVFDLLTALQTIPSTDNFLADGWIEDLR